jgi:putative DNA primase/helicase
MTGAAEIVRALRGRWYAAGYGIARCVAHEDRSPSLKISDSERGVLLVHCYAGCDASRILAELRRQGFVERGREIERPDPTEQKRAAEQRRRDRERRIGEALAIWREARPATSTIAARYLRERGITVPIPPSIRFHPALKHGPTGLLLPAMIAGVQDARRFIVGVHRTFLTADGRDKAAISDPKMSLGPIGGGAVRLAVAAHEIAIGEGIETCLSYMQQTGRPAWAALSTSGLRSIVLPPLPLASVVYIAADVDPNGAGEAAAKACAQRLTEQGRKIKIAVPPEGGDFNDSIRPEHP